MNPTLITELQKRLKEEINEQGYAFQAASLQKLSQMYSEKRSIWKFQASELPVILNRYETRCDAVLQHKESKAFMIIECKRANPAYSNWCFFRSFAYRRNQSEKEIYNGVKLSQAHLSDSVLHQHSASALFDIPLAIKSNQKGNRSDGRTNTEAISLAVTQAIISSGGFQNFLLANGEMEPCDNEYVGIIPVVLTTANLFTSSTLLSGSELSTGNIEDVSVTETNIVPFRTYISPSMTHSKQEEVVYRKNGEIGDLFDNKYVRTVWIVNVNGLQDFIKKSFEDLVEFSEQ